MSTSPVRTRQLPRPSLPSQAASVRPPRGESVVVVVRSILLAVAAVSVIATSNYFAYLIGRKQVTYEELQRQVDRVVQLMDQKRTEEELALTTLKQRQERLEQNAPALAGLTTSTINGKTVATPEPPAPAGKPIAAALVDDTAVVPPDHEVHLPPPESPPNAATKHLDTHGAASQRGLRRHKVLPAPAAPRPTEPALAAQPGQYTAAVPAATPDVGLAGQ